MIRCVDDLSELEKLALIDMSFSRIENYLSCASKFFYTYILKEERLFGPAATLGNVIHAVLEDTVDGEGSLDLLEMLQLMEVHREDLDPDHLIGEELMSAGSIMLSEFVDRHGTEKITVIEREMSFNFVLGSGLFRGFIDRVEDGGAAGIRFTDWKSGKFEVTQKGIENNLQLGIYALAIAQLYPGRPIYGELYYLRSGKRKGHQFTPENIEAVEARLLDIVDGIITDTHFKSTQVMNTCFRLCDFGKSGVCPTGKARLNR